MGARVSCWSGLAFKYCYKLGLSDKEVKLKNDNKNMGGVAALSGGLWVVSVAGTSILHRAPC